MLANENAGAAKAASPNFNRRAVEAPVSILVATAKVPVLVATEVATPAEVASESFPGQQAESGNRQNRNQQKILHGSPTFLRRDCWSFDRCYFL
jgi:hypothetical protein